MWLPVGLGLGIAAWFGLADRSGWIAVGLGAGGLAIAGFAFGRGSRLLRALAIFAFACLAGLALSWWRAERLDHVVLARPTIAVVAGTIERVERLAARDKVRLTLAPADAALPRRVRVSIDSDVAPAGLETGARVQMRARLVAPPGAAVPGAYDFARVAWFLGIGATGSAMGPVTIVAPAPEGGGGQLLAQWRERLQRHILSRLDDAGAAGVAGALATGDQGAIPESDTEAMRASGLAHLLSVSGLHLTAVVGATMFLTIRLLALWPWLALRVPLLLAGAGAGALAGISYTLLTGAEVPTLRSCIASLLVLAGIALGREALTLRLVGAGAFVLLLLWPEALVGPSFALSFAAITAIVALHEEQHVAVWFARREEPWWARGLRTLGSLLLTGFVVELALSPIALFHFHKTGLYGAIANIVAIPLTTFAIMPLVGAALLLDIAGLGAPMWWLAGQALALLLGIAHRVAALPGAVGMLPAMPVAAFALMVAGGIWLALWRTPVRLAGVVPILIGVGWALVARPADLLVTGDGKHVLLREESGRLALLRPKAGDFVRSSLAEVSGSEASAPVAIDDLDRARCSADLCSARLEAGGRAWLLLATRSPYRIDIGSLTKACRRADIVVSDRRLPRTCTPRWLKADPSLLRRSGGLAVDLSRGAVTSVADTEGDHPWAAARRATAPFSTRQFSAPSGSARARP